MIQHGNGEDPDGLPALIARANAAAGGQRATRVPEKRWLLAFLQVRADDLRRPHDSASQQVWAESVDRVDAPRELVRSDQHSLAPPVTLTVSGDQ